MLALCLGSGAKIDAKIGDFQATELAKLDELQINFIDELVLAITKTFQQKLREHLNNYFNDRRESLTNGECAMFRTDYRMVNLLGNTIFPQCKTEIATIPRSEIDIRKVNEILEVITDHLDLGIMLGPLFEPMLSERLLQWHRAQPLIESTLNDDDKCGNAWTNVMQVIEAEILPALILEDEKTAHRQEEDAKSPDTIPSVPPKLAHYAFESKVCPFSNSNLRQQYTVLFLERLIYWVTGISFNFNLIFNS